LPKKFRSRAAFNRNAAFVHIHNIPHHPQRTVEIAGNVYHPKHTGEKVGQCVNCGRPPTHYHGRHGCCGHTACHFAIQTAHVTSSERNTPSDFGLFPRVSSIARGKGHNRNPWTGL
jgi:hypothetical protein